MGKERLREEKKRGLVGNWSDDLSSSLGSQNIPAGPVFYPSEEEFKDPLEYINMIRPEAEPYGICKIVPPSSWKPPFALDMDSFTFPTKTQAIHQLQVRCASSDPKTFALDYNRFLEKYCGKKAKKRVVFEGEALDMCKLFNAVKRFGGYDAVSRVKKWGEVFRFMRPIGKISECSKHVLSQLYWEHLHDYEEYYYRLNRQKNKSCKRDLNCGKKCETKDEIFSYKRRRRNEKGERVEVHKAEEEELGQICEQCRSGLHGEVMLLCDRCNKGWHIYCLSPPLKRIPPGNWYCFECLNSDKDSFGFVQGKQFSLEGFRRVADRVKKKWFGSAHTSRMQLEQKFWEIVEGSVGELEIMYGSDLDTFVYGSGFPRAIDKKPSSVDVNIWNEYCTSPWNLNNLPRLPGSMLRAVHHNIAGVMVPWLYVGMLFSSFCWHFEDHCFYSMNYLHWGEPKCWYSVPGNEAHSFEKVMRDSLPDLFEAQPDLLFQLVTMLNPSVLLAKGVPVYSILQEPGNFVITFPRSYHGGFNFGLNCAEAVNFAPADWLSHGGFGAELYRHYHKAAVLSHEELLCVAAKNDIDTRLSAHLKTELLRIYEREKNWRERLWRNGITRSSLMLSRKQPEYVGAEEDSMCVICQQFLYLSAVGCNCRPLTFVCLEHWEHLCECTPNKLRLFYRHSLAELNDLLHTVDKPDSKEAAGALRRKSCTEKALALAKKMVKGGHVTHVQLAEEWILRACKSLEHPYSRHAYATVIEEAEQFLWAGSEMDFVREMRNNLVQAKNWAEDVRECISIVKLWSKDGKCDIKKIQMDRINKLLSLSNVPCNEPGHLQIQEYQQEASKLTNEINSALSNHSEISVADLENLCAKAIDLPICIPESEILEYKLSAVKAWLENARNCINQKSRSSVEIDMLYKLVAEILDLQLQLPETEALTVLTRKAKSCQSRCSDMLKNWNTLENVEQFLSEFEDFTVSIPELNLLRKYYDDTTSWKCRVNLALTNIHEREDQENVVDELIILQRDASLLQIQVHKLPHLELELTKACWRVKAIKAFRSKMSMDFIQQLMSEATILLLEKEKLFTDLSQRLAVAMSLEEKAKLCLGNKAEITEFEDVLRASDDIGIILPSLHDVMDAISVANVWLMKSKPFLIRDSSIVSASEPCLRVDVLKELVLESEHLKINLAECLLLDKVLKKCIDWEQDVSSLLQAAEKLWNIDIIGDGIASSFISELECQVLSTESAIKTGLSLGLEFTMIPKLQDACSMLKWFIKALSFSFVIPSTEEVGMMLDAAVQIPSEYKSCTLVVALIDGLNWLGKALKCLDPHGHLQLELGSVEEVLVIYEKIGIPFPIIVSQLRDAIQKHNLWLEQVILFFGMKSEDRTGNVLLRLKEVGNAEAFRCNELEKILSEVNKVEQWKLKCEDIVKQSMAKEIPLLCALIEIKDTLEKSFDIYNTSKNGAARIFCTCCPSNVEQQELLTCSVCKESFHRHCSTPSLEDAMFVCTFCDFVKSSILPPGGFGSLKAGRKHLELDKLSILLSDANDLCLWNKERRILHQVVEKAHACNDFLTELMDFALAYVAKDLTIVFEKLCTALKATEVAAACDGLGIKKLEQALARNSWKIRAEKLLGSSEKPTIQQVLHYLKEGDAVNIPPEDYYRLKLAEFRDVGLQWANIAKKVSMDGGLLELNKVFELILEGENLPAYCGKELKLLRDRSMLYCICRRPYDQRAMIACDKCDEWYHFDCIEISLAPKIYICPACDLHPNEDICESTRISLERYSWSKFEEPHTPLRRSELRRNSRRYKSFSKKAFMDVDSTAIRNFSGSDRLLWRNRKTLRRAARKRSELETLSPFFYVQNS